MRERSAALTIEEAVRNVEEISTPTFFTRPERGLWAAIVTDAIDVCLGRTFARPNEKLAAHRWIESSRADVGGFLWCCQLLGLDENAVRRRIRRPYFRYANPSASRRACRA